MSSAQCPGLKAIIRMNVLYLRSRLEWVLKPFIFRRTMV
jgi:hypothetical protein